MAELKVLKLSLGVTRVNRIRNEYMRETAQAERFGNKVKGASLRWFGYVERRNCGYTGLPGRRRGSPQRRFMDVVNEDMQRTE